MTTKIEVLTIPDCPNGPALLALVHEAVAEAGIPADVTSRVVSTEQDAVSVGMRGSPTLRVDGVDPFPGGEAAGSLSCRVYPTPHGLRGLPPLEQVVDVLARA